MEPSIACVVVFRFALSTERPSGHRCSLAVVRQRPNQGEARTAVRARDVGILESATALIEHLLEALVAYRLIGGNPGRRRAASFALANQKPGQARPRRDRRFDRHDVGGGRRFGLYPAGEGVDFAARALDMDLDPAVGVQHPSCQPMRGGKTRDERAKADALYRSADDEVAGLNHVGRRTASRRSSMM
jgi:hypothetical protein